MFCSWPAGGAAAPWATPTPFHPGPMMRTFKRADKCIQSILNNWYKNRNQTKLFMRFYLTNQFYFPHFSNATLSMPPSLTMEPSYCILSGVPSAGSVLLPATGASHCWRITKCYSYISTSILFGMVQGSWLLVSLYNDGECQRDGRTDLKVWNRRVSDWMDVQVDGWTDGWLVRWMYWWTDGRTDRWMVGWMHWWTDGWMHGWMHW